MLNFIFESHNTVNKIVLNSSFTVEEILYNTYKLTSSRPTKVTGAVYNILVPTE